MMYSPAPGGGEVIKNRVNGAWLSY